MLWEPFSLKKYIYWKNFSHAHTKFNCTRKYISLLSPFDKHHRHNKAQKNTASTIHPFYLWKTRLRRYAGENYMGHAWDVNRPFQRERCVLSLHMVYITFPFKAGVHTGIGCLGSRHTPAAFLLWSVVTCHVFMAHACYGCEVTHLLLLICISTYFSLFSQLLSLSVYRLYNSIKRLKHDVCTCVNVFGPYVCALAYMCV